MIVVVDERELVKDGYTSLFGREGVPSTGFDPSEFGEWVNTAADTDIDAVEAFLIGQGSQALSLPRAIRDRSTAPVIAVSDSPSLETTLAFFDCGVDDVVRKPVHPREILARAAAIRRRLKAISNYTDIGAIRVFSDGRDRKSKAKSSASAARAPHSGIFGRQPRPSRLQDADLQRNLRHL